MTDRVQFLPGALERPIDERMETMPGASLMTRRNAVVQRDLDRYYTVLTLALAQVHLTPNEALLICDALNGTFIDVYTAQLLHAEIEDSLPDGLAEKWDVDGAALVAKLRDLSLLQQMAVCDAVERWWRNTYDVDDGRARLVRVGLVRGRV